jgi:hypothetical protein
MVPRGNLLDGQQRPQSLLSAQQTHPRMVFHTRFEESLLAILLECLKLYIANSPKLLLLGAIQNCDSTMTVAGADFGCAVRMNESMRQRQTRNESIC